MRLRIFDWNTPWFWCVIFYQKAYGKPIFEASIYRPAGWTRWWFHFWMLEPIPSEVGGYAEIAPSIPEPTEPNPAPGGKQ